MDADRIEELYNEIRTGIRCVSFEGRILFFHYPSPKVLSAASLIERQMELEWGGRIPKSAKALEFLTNGKPEYNIDELRKTQGRLVNTLSHMRDKAKLPETDSNVVFYSAELRKVLNRIKCAEKFVKLAERAADFYCLDTKIQNRVLIFLLVSCTFYESADGPKKYFKEAKFSSERDRNRSIMELLVPFNRFRSGYTEAEMRGVARSGLVSNMYNTAATTGTPMFPGSASEYTHVQNILLFWCRYYFNVMKNLGWPEDTDVIDDDKAFDEWVKNKIEEISKPSKDSGGGDKHGNTSVHRHKIVFKNPVRATS